MLFIILLKLRPFSNLKNIKKQLLRVDIYPFHINPIEVYTVARREKLIFSVTRTGGISCIGSVVIDSILT